MYMYYYMEMVNAKWYRVGRYGGWVKNMGLGGGVGVEGRG